MRQVHNINENYKDYAYRQKIKRKHHEAYVRFEIGSICILIGAILIVFVLEVNMPFQGIAHILTFAIPLILLGLILIWWGFRIKKKIKRHRIRSRRSKRKPRRHISPNHSRRRKHSRNRKLHK